MNEKLKASRDGFSDNYYVTNLGMSNYNEADLEQFTPETYFVDADNVMEEKENTTCLVKE